jgi:Ca2+-transporting ATPase
LPITFVQGLTLPGLVGLMDPPRPEAAEAIARCRRAGIQVNMITGDHKITAGALRLYMGINACFTGVQLLFAVSAWR